MWTASDEALVAGLAGGDRDAALVLVRRFQARVFGLALSITGDRTIAEEAAQDAFVKAWRYAASYDPRRGSVGVSLRRRTVSCRDGFRGRFGALCSRFAGTDAFSP